ncbi:MAG: family 20 glycosylhydrolase [Oscillospiraceae bacterium]|nr:family 20 glycosylhydrolase [Oscillospiraceae bacterium]
MEQTNLKLDLNIDKDLFVAAEKLCDLLGVEIGDGITVTAEKSDRTGVVLKNGKAHITYSKKHLFFRELGLLVEYARKTDEFELWEDGYFECISAMIDASRGAVPSVSGMKKLIDHLAVMGYSMVMLYTEDVIELPGYEYFGYMRGRYSADELREIDDYAHQYGIEAIPCLECYGHMEKYLMWNEASPIKDTSGVLLAREEKTFEFLDKLIATVSSCFRSKRMHIGMDEAWDMGRGNFLTKHGYVPPFEIFNEYMERLIKITDKYGLTPMMWSDMYFRVNTDNNGYYGKDIVVAKEVLEKVPEGVELVFWHYGEEPHCDDYMLKKHKEFNRKIIYAGGFWSWIGHFPENNYTLDAVRFSLDACRKNDVREAMATVWSNDGSECDLYANLLPLSFFAELCYNNDADDQKLKERFEATTGGDYDAFFAMSNYHNTFENGEVYETFPERFMGKQLFWQDILEGLYDTHFFKKHMSGHYAENAERMKKYFGGKWDYLYRFASLVFDYLAEKAYIAENLHPAYNSDDKAMLKTLSEKNIPALIEKTKLVHNMHREIWHDKLKAFGWSNLDVRYAGVVARCETAKLMIDRYLGGKLDRLEQLDEVRLEKPLGGFTHYSMIATPNLKI